MSGVPLSPALFRQAERWSARLDYDPATGCEVPQIHERHSGQVTVDGFPVMLHRMFWVVHTGQPLEPGARLIRTCGTRRCVSPAHRILEPPKPKVPGL